MSVWLWQTRGGGFCELVLWDGEHTYWNDEMIPSGGYKKMRKNWSAVTNSRFVYVGEL